MARAFEEGDYFELTAVGVAANGTEKRVSINLIEFTDGELKALNDWTFFDLSSLGKVTSVYFELNSTDSGSYGMNTAAYFCMDKFQVKAEDSAAPTFSGYTDDGIHAYVVTINPTENSVIYYRIQSPDGEWTEWMEYTESLPFKGSGKYRVEAYAVAPGKAPSTDIAYEFVVASFTGIDEMNAGKAVASVRYYNMAGQEMQQADGLTIVVTTYTDGTSSAVKVIK
jgi:hypothetical protein